MNAAIEALGVAKAYGARDSRQKALDGLSLQVPEGSIYGILGQNGAGKSTLFRLCAGLIRPDQGHIRVLGMTPGQDDALCTKVGALIETPRFFGYLTAADTLRMLARLAGQPLALSPFPLLERVGLAAAANRKVKGFSVGMMQRLAMAATLISRPRLVILDEPTSGMDPAGIQDMRLLIRELARDGVTVVMASHQLEEVSKLCERVAVLGKGRLVLEGLVSELLRARTRLRLVVDPMERAMELLGERVERQDQALMASIDREEAPQLINALVAAQVRIFEARWMDEDLESVFFRETSAAADV